MTDRVRVQRLLIYEGPRDQVEAQLKLSVHGTKSWGRDMSIFAVTLSPFPEVIPPSSRLEKLPSKIIAELANIDACYPDNDSMREGYKQALLDMQAALESDNP